MDCKNHSIIIPNQPTSDAQCHRPIDRPPLTSAVCVADEGGRVGAHGGGAGGVPRPPHQPGQRILPSLQSQNPVPLTQF